MMPSLAGPRRVLAFLRHAEFHKPPHVPSAHLPHGLTPLGVTRAGRVASTLLDFTRAHALELDPIIDCSCLRRAWETAYCLAAELRGLTGAEYELQEFAELAERGLGAAANLRRDEIEDIVRADPRFEAPPLGWQSDPAYRLPLPGAESLEQAGRRVANHLAARAREHRDTSTLKIIIGHGAAFRHAACQLGLLEPAATSRLTLDPAAAIYFERRASPGDPERMIHVAGHWRERSPKAAT